MVWLFVLQFGGSQRLASCVDENSFQLWKHQLCSGQESPLQQAKAFYFEDLCEFLDGVDGAWRIHGWDSLRSDRTRLVGGGRRSSGYPQSIRRPACKRSIRTSFLSFKPCNGMISLNFDDCCHQPRVTEYIIEYKTIGSRMLSDRRTAILMAFQYLSGR